MLTDIVNEAVFCELTASELRDADAKHVMYAAANDCRVSVTLGTRDILPLRIAIETACPQPSNPEAH